MKRAALLLLSFVVLSVAFGAIIKDRPTAVSNGTDIYLRWNTEDEGSVQSFVVLRRAGVEGDFLQVITIPPKGNYSSYEYVDRSVFKATDGVYQYRVRVHTGPNTYSETEAVSVSHASSTARRTWGSIKAMFR